MLLLITNMLSSIINLNCPFQNMPKGRSNNRIFQLINLKSMYNNIQLKIRKTYNLVSLRIKIIRRTWMKEHIIRKTLIHYWIKKNKFKKAVYRIIINKVINQLIKLAIKTIKIYNNLIYKTRTINKFQMKSDNQTNSKFHTLPPAHTTNSKDNRITLFKMLKEVKLTLVHLSSHNLKKIEAATLIQMNISTKIEIFRIRVNMHEINNYWVDPAKTIVSSTVKPALTINVQMYYQQITITNWFKKTIKRFHNQLIGPRNRIFISKEIISLFKDPQLMKKVMWWDLNYKTITILTTAEFLFRVTEERVTLHPSRIKFKLEILSWIIESEVAKETKRNKLII